MHRASFKQRTAERRAAFGCDWNISDIINEFAREAVGLGTVEGPVFLARNMALSASQSRAADLTRVCSTVCRSKVERLITFSTSAVAVCCCRDSRSSLSRRVFSMAMTAWAAKFLTNSICFSM